MYKINFKNYLNLITIDCLHWGIENNIIDPKSAIEFANEYIVQNPNDDNPIIIDLLIIDTCDKNNILSIINDGDDGADKELSIRRLRYAILQSLSDTIHDNEELLSSIEDVYVDFNYPKDMDQFITYMPVTDKTYDVSVHIEEENKQYLVDKFWIFLKKEYDSLK